MPEFTLLFDAYNAQLFSYELPGIPYPVEKVGFTRRGDSAVRFSGFSTFGQIISACSNSRYVIKPIVIICDNGAGFDASTQSCEIGFANIRNRASLFKGEVRVIATPATGCTANVFFPATNEQVMAM